MDKSCPQKPKWGVKQSDVGELALNNTLALVPVVAVFFPVNALKCFVAFTIAGNLAA
jgi:hypothetical protein